MRLGLPLGLTAYRRLAGEAPPPGPDPDPDPNPDPDPEIVMASGMNYPSTSYYSIEFPFTNLMRKCNTWRAENVNGEGYFDHPLPPMDEHGWPMEMPSGGSTFLDLIVTNHYDEAVLGNTLRITFDGDDSTTDERWAGNLRMTWPCQTNRVGPNEYIVTTNGATALTLRIDWLNPADHIRNIKIELAETGEFRQAFLDRQEGMRVMRFMDWMNTNLSPIVEFDEWPTEDDFPSVGGYNRVPIAVMCRAAISAGVPPWFCIPHLASDDFIEKFAYEVAENIDPTLPIYIEYSNECWNATMYEQYNYCIAQGNALGLPGEDQWRRAAQFYGIRARQIEEIIRPIFGSRLKMVFAWQAVNPSIADAGLSYGDTAAHMDVLAIAPYFGTSLGDFDYPTADDSYSIRVKNQGLPYVFSFISENIEGVLRDNVQIWVGMAEQYGCEIACYEAGQHLVGNGPANDDLELREIFFTANRDPRMGDAYRQFAAMWMEETALLADAAPEGAIVAWYNSLWEPTASGDWGAMRNEADVDAPKWLAIQGLVDQTPVTYPDYPPFPPRPEPDPEPDPEPEPARLQAVGTRGEIAYSQGNAVTANTRKVTCRTKHHFGPVAVSEFQVGYANFYVGDWTTGNIIPEIAAPADASVRLYVEMNGVSVQAMWNGAAVGVIPAGGHVFCDPMLPEQFGLTEFPAYGLVWLRVEKTAPVGSRHMYHTLTGDPAPPITGEFTAFGQITATSKIEGTGVMTTAGGWTAFGGYQLPIAIIGRPKAPMKAYGIVGASIEHGAGDSNRGDGENGGGYIRRALWNEKHPFIALQRGSEAAQSFIGNSAMRRPLLQYCNAVICGHGGNDYSYGYSAENTQNRLATIWGLVKSGSMPGATVHQVTLSPKTDSTDSWATIANQTPRTGYGPGGAWRDAVDAWVAAQVSPNPDLDGVLNIRPAQDASSSLGRWRVDLGQPTTDGTHPSGPVHIAMANLLRTMLP